MFSNIIMELDKFFESTDPETKLLGSYLLMDETDESKIEEIYDKYFKGEFLGTHDLGSEINRKYIRNMLNLHSKIQKKKTRVR